MDRMDQLKQVYDKTYRNVENYNFFDKMKNVFVDAYAVFIDGVVLDAGCGEGIHLKRLLAKGHNVFGIELSTVCCERYLQGVAHKNTDLVSHAAEGRRYAGIICMDVLEHIPAEDIEASIAALAAMSPSVLLGIANHSDVIQGVELHLIRENAEWWKKLLQKYFQQVDFIDSFHDDRFFLLQCYKTIPEYRNRLSKVYEIMHEYVLAQQELACQRQHIAMLENQLAARNR